MCGIAGIYLKNPDENYVTPKEIENLVDWLLCGIEHRGTHATGIAVQDKDGETFLEKSDMAASKFIFWRRDLIPNPRCIILHTRLHTKGKPENLLNNHPVQYGNIMMVHNGHISNDDELFKDEELERFAEVDSEIIPALLHKYGMLEPKTALEKMSGGFAIAAIDEENPGKLLLAKGQTSPLVYYENSAMWIWASEENAIIDAFKYSLGYEVRRSNIKTVKYGEYILVDGENHEKADFQPYYKTNTSAAYYGGHNPNQVKYGDGWHRNDDKCDDCFRYFPKYQLNKVDQNYYCDFCESRLFDIAEDGARIPKKKKKLTRKERKQLRKEARRKIQEAMRPEASKKEEKPVVNSVPNIVNASDMEIGDVLNEEHWFVCELVSEFFGTNKEFVDMILFSEDFVAEDDPMLSTIFVEFHEKYREFLDDVRDDTDVVLNRISEQSKKSKKFPVGFNDGVSI